MAGLPPPPPPPGQWQSYPPPQPAAPPYAPSPYGVPGYGQPPPPGWAYVAPLHATRLGRLSAGFGERLGAYLLDVLLIALISAPLWIGGIVFVASDWQTYDAVCEDARGFEYDCAELTDATAGRLFAAIALGGIGLLLIWIFYWGHFEGRRGATPGKRAVGIETVHPYTGAPIGFGRAVGRSFARYLSSQIFFLGYLWMLWDDNKQTWHDKIVSSIVVKTEQ